MAADDTPEDVAHAEDIGEPGPACHHRELGDITIHWVRPFGRQVYLMPAYIIDDEDLRQLCDRLTGIISDLDAA